MEWGAVQTDCPISSSFPFPIKHSCDKIRTDEYSAKGVFI